MLLEIWTAVEPGVGIFIGSLACLRPLFRRILGGGSDYDSRQVEVGTAPVSPLSPGIDGTYPLDYLKRTSSKPYGVTTWVHTGPHVSEDSSNESR
jgi:hypothetical protein